MSPFQNTYSKPNGTKLIDYFYLPSIITDKKFNIIYSNRLWQDLFENQTFENVNQFLKAEIFQKLESFIKNSYYKDEALVDDNVVILKSKNANSSYSLLVYSYPVSSKDYFILSFKPHSFNFDAKDKSGYNGISFLTKQSDIQNYISITLQELFDSVADIIPLSLVNKNKVKMLLDEREEIIWLKDTNDNIILANKNYFDVAGIQETDIQKKSEDYLFFPYQKDLLKNLTEYSKIIRKPILVHGLKYSSDLVENYPLVIYPIVDKQGKYYVFFNILLKETQKFQNESVARKSMDDLSIPFLSIDSNKNIIETNSAFNSLIGNKIAGNIHEIFNQNLIEKLDDLLFSEKENKSIFIDSNFSITSIENSDFIIRIFNGKNNSFDLLLYPLKHHEDIKTIISQRGKMLDYYIQNSPEPIFVFEKESLKFLEINQSALKLYGYNRDEFLKLDLTDLYSPEDFQSLMESLKNSTNQKTTPVFRQKTKDGRDIYVQLTYNDFKYNGLDSFFVIVNDITDKLLLENENKLYKELIENTSDIIIETDEFGFIKSVNNTTVTKLGYDKNFLLDTSFSTLVNDDERGMINSNLFNSKLKSFTQIKSSIKKADGQLVNADIISVPVKSLNQEIISFKLIISLEEQAKEYIPEIREVIKEVYIEKPEQKTDVITNQNFLSSDFLSGVFHEILTPLNVIFGFTQEIVEGLEKPTPEQKEAADIISQNRIKLLDTMNSVVEYSELISNKSYLNISEFNIVEIIEKLEKQAKDIASTLGIQFTLGKISQSLRVESDAEKLERVIIGLIKIVCRLSQQKKVYLSAFALDQELFFISVTDQYNSSSEYLTNSLNKIFNLNVEPRDIGAPRLTVHLTRFFMNLLKMKFVDKIKINNKTESGFLSPLRLTQTETLEHKDEKNKIESKQFIISEIPDVTTKESETKNIDKQETSKKSEEIKSSVPRVNLSELTCLYIEDQIDSQVLFKVQLKELKEIVVAPSFEEALPHLESRKFDFIVIDINLEGEYNGLDALKMIRKIPGYENIPVFASTAYILPGNKERFIAAGFNGFIDKPIFKERIIESLDKILSN